MDAFQRLACAAAGIADEGVEFLLGEGGLRVREKSVYVLVRKHPYILPYLPVSDGGRISISYLHAVRTCGRQIFHKTAPENGIIFGHKHEWGTTHAGAPRRHGEVFGCILHVRGALC